MSSSCLFCTFADPCPPLPLSFLISLPVFFHSFLQLVIKGKANGALPCTASSNSATASFLRTFPLLLWHPRYLRQSPRLTDTAVPAATLVTSIRAQTSTNKPIYQLLIFFHVDMGYAFLWLFFPIGVDKANLPFVIATLFEEKILQSQARNKRISLILKENVRINFPLCLPWFLSSTFSLSFAKKHHFILLFFLIISPRSP